MAEAENKDEVDVVLDGIDEVEMDDESPCSMDSEFPIPSDWLEFDVIERSERYVVSEDGSGYRTIPVSCHHFVNLRRDEIASVEQGVEKLDDGKLARSLSCTKLVMRNGHVYTVLMAYEKVMELV